MKSVFQRVAGEIRKRHDLVEAIRHEKSLISGNKLAAVVDLDRCFYNAALKPRGIIGTLHNLFVERAMQEMTFALHFEGMAAHTVPVSLAKAKTRENLDKWWETNPLVNTVETADGKLYITPAERPQHFITIHFDDYLSVIEQYALASGKLTFSAMVGDGDNTLGILKEIRAVPDYSEHFPPRPPRDGDKSKRREEEQGGFVPPVLVPGAA